MAKNKFGILTQPYIHSDDYTSAMEITGWPLVSEPFSKIYGVDPSKKIRKL